MNEFLFDFIRNATLAQKGLFLMIVGILFVFTVQTVFYLTIKIWLRMSQKKSG